MDKSDKPENVCINLEFSRSQSLSKQEKIKEFWKFLDSRNVLKPFKEQPVVQEEKSFETNDRCNSPSPPGNNNASSSKVISTKPKQNMKISKVRQKNRNDDLCKLEKYFREDLRYADTVEVSYDELNAEIEEYQKQLLRCNCRTKNCDCKKK